MLREQSKLGGNWISHVNNRFCEERSIFKTANSKSHVVNDSTKLVAIIFRNILSL